MKQHLVFTVLAKNKPGIITTLANTIKAQQGNWLDSHFSQLAGEFAGIVCIEVKSDKKSQLIDDLKSLSQQHIAIQISENKTPEVDNETKEVSIEIMGNDRPGIVADLSTCFSEFDIDITQLETFTTEAAMSGGQLFHANATIQLHKKISQDKLRDKLFLLSEKLSLDIEWTASI